MMILPLTLRNFLLTSFDDDHEHHIDLLDTPLTAYHVTPIYHTHIYNYTQLHIFSLALSAPRKPSVTSLLCNIERRGERLETIFCKDIGAQYRRRVQFKLLHNVTPLR